ncbi:glycosyltransferase family 39 protein [Dechloromonas sp. H13]|uniref:glycosyltransferase family 39 protein n=1 Tax=Dechloromonas sp. H13 TaxID=2570193 RepID=UPI001290B7E8|nr:glycosyltransferase family 39 protein [Dechloromonas sp. H13]
MTAVAVDAGIYEKSGGKILLGLTALLLAWRFWVVPRMGVTLYVDEAQYWTWAQHLDWGYFSKPPGVAALIALSTTLFGDGLLGVKALAMLCYPLAAAACWAIARRLYDARVAFWSALAVLTLPIFAWLGLFVSTDALLTLFWALALWAYLRALDSDAWGDWLLLGAICGLGLLSKYTMAAWLGAAFLHLLAFHRRRLASPKPWLATGVALLILGPNLGWNVAHDFPTLKHTADITVNRKAGGGLKALGEFWAAQWGAFGPVLGSVFFILLFQVRKSWSDERTRLLLWFALPLWAVVSAQAFKSTANANWAAPAFAPAAIAVVAWLLQRGRQRLLIAGIALNIALIGVAYHWPLVLAAVDGQKQAKMNFYARAQGWDDLGRQLTPLLQAYPDAVLIADNRTLLAHMLYEVRDLRRPAASWNPAGIASDHYKLTTDLRPWLGRDAILIREDPIDEEFTRRFASSEQLAALQAPLPGEQSRTMNVYLLRDFKGY